MNSNKHKNSNLQIGTAVGMLVACVMTLLSILFGLEPEVVLYRAVLGGSGVAIFDESILGRTLGN